MDDRQLVKYFAELAGRLLSAETVDGTMDVIVGSAIEIIDGCDHASISHMRGKALVSAASDDEVGKVLDGIQTGAREGPCLDTVQTGQINIADDLATDERWPTYGPAAVESTGVISSLALPLHHGERLVGALNLFSNVPRTFRGNDSDDAVGAILAAHATPALVAALHRTDMAAALESRDIIGQAKGMLMARGDTDDEAAFELLVNASQRMNVKVTEVARRLVAGKLREAPRD